MQIYVYVYKPNGPRAVNCRFDVLMLIVCFFSARVFR